MNIIIFDFEVFKYDTLFGAKIHHKEDVEVFQTWDLNEIKEFYEQHKRDLWVGQNILNYDNIILYNILHDKNPYLASQKIIKNNDRTDKYKLNLFCYDLNCEIMYSLKVTEAAVGKNISESEVDFDIDRRLTQHERELTESYNRDDLNQTSENFFDKDNFGTFKVKWDIVKQYNLSYKHLNSTGTKLGELVFGVKRVEGIENEYVYPKIYDCLQLKNEDLLNFYKTEGFRKNQKLKTVVCGLEHTFGCGGAHSAIKKYYTPHALYFDVSGYYNLTMMNFNLLPRSMSDKAKELYKEMYYLQLKYKKTAPEKRPALKVILLSVFGAMMSEYSGFYDPQHGTLVTITGQLFITDLLEKLEGLIKVVQTNTDGIIIEPLNWDDEEKIMDIVRQWEKRTGYVIKKDHIYELYQRDVNNYIFKNPDGSYHVKGEALRQYITHNRIFYGGNGFDYKEPNIVALGLTEYLMNKTKPEEIVEKYKTNLREFQYICKKKSYDYTTYEETDYMGNTKITKLQGINRVFAYNNKNVVGMIYKYKGKSKVKVSNLPPSVFVYDNEILSDESKNYLCKLIDYNYYVQRIYERINEFIENEQEQMTLCFN